MKIKSTKLNGLPSRGFHRIAKRLHEKASKQKQMGFGVVKKSLNNKKMGNPFYGITFGIKNYLCLLRVRGCFEWAF